MNWFTHGSVPFIRHSHGGENGRAKADVIYWVDYEREGVNKSLARPFKSSEIRTGLSQLVSAMCYLNLKTSFCI